MQDFFMFHNRASATSFVINALSVKNKRLRRYNLNFTTEDRNEGTMFPETIPSILLHAL